MKRNLAIGVLLLLVITAGFGGDKAQNESALGAHVFLLAKQGSAGGTSLHLYAPFSGGSVAAGIRIARTTSGYCWTTSIADARGDAFRCFVGNNIHDPCFADQTGSAHYVLCPLYTPAAKVLRINLTKKLPLNSASGDPTRYPPWALKTVSGKWCTRFTGATGNVAGMAMTYGCTGGGLLLGSPRRSTTTWKIFYASSYKAKQYRSIALRSAWW